MKKILIISLVIIIFIAFIVLVFWRKSEKINKPSDHSFVSGDEQNEESIKNKQNEESTNNGLKIEVLQAGEGEEAKNGDNVSVHYTGRFEDGTKFDSSLDRGVPFSFKLGAGQVIKGWDLGVLGMKTGEKRKLTISPELAYGKSGIPGAIPPNATLIFEVEFLGIK